MAIPSNGFRGVVRFRTWFGRHLYPTHTWPAGPFRPDYGDSFDWQMFPSPRGGYFIRGWCGPPFIGQSWYFWQTDMSDPQRKIILHPGGDDWETFLLEAHPMGGYALRSFANGNRYVCAEPESHDIHLVANRDAARQWEQFQIDVVRQEIPDDPEPPRPERKPFICSNCRKVIGHCEGGVLGQKCVLCSHATGRCKCEECDQEFFEISHTHA